MTSRLPWTPAEVDRAAAMWRDGATADAIAAAVGKTSAAVALRLHRLRAAGGGVESRHPLTKWTPERDERLLALWGTAATVASIAATMGTTERSVQGRMDVLRPKCPWAPRRKPGGPGSRAWTEADDATIVRMRAEGATGDAIAAALGCTRPAAVNRVTTLRRRGVDVALPRRDGPSRRRRQRMAEVNVHTVTDTATQLYEEIRQRAPSADLAADEVWRKQVWRAAKRLAEAREDAVLLLLETAPRKALADG